MKTKLLTYWRLGLQNIVWVALYRLALRLGFVTRNMLIKDGIVGPFFFKPLIKENNKLDSINSKGFGWFEYSKEKPPLWNRSFISGKDASSQFSHWSKVSDFNQDIGDIKTVWELSRFDWVLHFTIEFLKSNDEKYIATMNSWLEDWSKENPANQGLNWKCGQEASIRVMHLCVALCLLNQDNKISPAIIEMLDQHLTRISPTVLYAMAQDNNHGTSEAVALYIGGIVLEANTNLSHAAKWKKKGLFWLENRVSKLITPDGSFSQYSVNYHRVILDSLSVAEFFRNKYSEPSFSKKFNEKVCKAIDWLRYFTDKDSGDAPNLGPNDGARLIPLTGTAYRDYRPSVQLASVLYYGKKAYKPGPYNQHLELLGLTVSDYLPELPENMDFNDGGYIYVSNELCRLYMRYPNFRFRPSHCDIFHLDLWLKGNNILKDAGSYSYNAEKRWQDYFPSTKAHNTIEFDNRNQMPRLSRFLLGSWLKVKHLKPLFIENKSKCFEASYVDSENAYHSRKVSLNKSSLTVIDNISGFNEKAVLRWRLGEGSYYLDGSTLVSDSFFIHIESTGQIVRMELVDGWESPLYMRKHKIQVLEVEVTKAAQLISKISWRS